MSIPEIHDGLSEEELDHIAEHAREAANLLKAVSHEGRLMILCHLMTGEKSVTELERLLSARQAAVSQQLARLRLEGLVVPRREGKVIYYSLADDKPRQLIETVYDLFCGKTSNEHGEAVSPSSPERSGQTADSSSVAGDGILHGPARPALG